MVSVVTGNGAGLFNSSRDLLGAGGELGQAQMGRNGERVTVNAANGNLVIQDRDEYLVGIGPDVDLLRTYNSNALVDGDNDDGWRMGYYRRLSEITAGSVKRTNADGHVTTYTLDGGGSGKFLSNEGSGSVDSLAFNSASGQWVWTDGDTGVTETYETIDGGVSYRLKQVTDTEGGAVRVNYDGAGLISTLQTCNAAGTVYETVSLSYDSKKRLTLVATDYRDANGNPAHRSLTRYDYNSVTDKLEQVTTDLTPEDSNTADHKVYIVSYGYGGDNRLRTITHKAYSGTNQQVIAQQTIDYYADGSAADGRVKSIQDEKGTTFFSYDVGNCTTTVTDVLGQVTTLRYYDASSGSAGQLKEVSGATLGGAGFKQSYTYLNGDLKTSTNAKGETTTYDYTSFGALQRSTDAAGNVVERTYNAQNLLESETVYTAPAANSQAASGPRKTWYLYDTSNGKQRLRFIVHADGTVTQYKYSGAGQVAWEERGSAVFTDPAPTYAKLDGWAWSTGDRISGDTMQASEYFYDARGNVTQIKRYANSWNAATNSGQFSGHTTELYNYDAFGRVLRHTDQSGETNYTYDGLNRISTSIDANQAVTLYTYDDANRKTSVRLDNGQTTVQMFDTQGHLVSSEVLGAVTQTSQGKTQYFYDALGRLRRTQDATGVSSYALYDVNGLKSADIAANGQLTEYFYDAAGHLIQSVAYATLLSPSTLSGITDATTVGNARPAVDDAHDRVTTFYYDKAGRLVGTLDADGYLIESRYDGTSALTSQIRYSVAQSVARLDPALGTTRSTVPAMTPPTQDWGLRTTRNLYDAAGRLAARIDGDGGLTLWTYDTSGHMLSQLRRSELLSDTLRTTGTLPQLTALAPLADDEFTQWVYDGQGRQIAMLDAEGYLTEYRYDNAARPTDTLRYLVQARKPVGTGLNLIKRADLDTLRPNLGTPVTTSRSYNSRGLLETETAADGTVTYYAYDQLQRLTSTTLAQGTSEQRIRTIGYDDWGRVQTTQVTGDGAGVTTAYDAAGRRKSVTDARGNTTYFYYDAQGRQIYAILRDPLAGGEVTETIYSNFSEVQATVTHKARLDLSAWAAACPNGTIDGGLASDTLKAAITGLNNNDTDNRTTRVYNKRGLIQQAVDALGYKTDTTYNAFGQVDRVTTDEGVAGGASQYLTKYYSYDHRGNLVERDEEDQDIGGWSDQYEFDALGRTTWSSNRDSYSTFYTYLRNTGTGRKVQIDDGAGSATTTYDALDRVVARTDRNGNTVTYVHDAVNRKVTMTTAEGIQVVTESNRYGQVYKVTDGTGATTTYGYDTHGNLLTVTDALGNVTQNGYDLNDNLIQVIQGLKANGTGTPIDDGSATTTRYTFDAANRVLTQTVDPDGALKLKTSYEYDGQGRRVKITDAANTVTTQSFTAKGELKEVIVDVGGLNLKTTYQYDAQSRAIEIVQGAGTTAALKTKIEYDGFGRRTAQIVDPEGRNLKTSYEYDYLDRLVSTRNSLGDIVALYFYDSANRMEFSVDSMGAITRNFYDGEGRLTGSARYAKRLEAGWQHDDYLLTYQLQSNLLALTVGSADVLSSNAYDKDGRLIYAVDALGNVTGFQYDKAGRMLERRQYSKPIAVTGAVYGLADVRSRLVLDDAKDSVVRYVYDAVGHQRYRVDALGYVTENKFDRAGRVTETVQYAQPIPVSERLNSTGTSLSNWFVYTPPTGSETITRVDDADRNEKVIALNGNGWNTGYQLSRDAAHSNWASNGTVISWDMKYAETFTFYVSVTTSKGHRYIEYDVGSGAPTGATGEYVHHYLSGLTDGQWHHVTRDLRADLAALQPDAEILSVDALLIRGSGRIGDVTISDPQLTLTGMQNLVTKSSAADRTTRYAYDAAGRQRFAVDAEGYVTETRYDDAASKTTTLRYANRISGSASYTPPDTPLTLAGLTTAAIGSLGAATTTIRTLDHAGRLSTVTDGNGVTQTITYDAAGRVETEVQASNIAGQSSTTRYAYNSAGQRISATRADGTALASTTRYEYDSLGRLWHEIDARGVALVEGNGAWEQGERERLKLTKDITTTPLSQANKDKLLAAYTVTYGYDAAGRVTSTTLPAAFDAAFDDTGWRTGTTSYTSTTEYDAFGNATVITDARGYKRYQVYDKAGRLVQAIDAERYLTTYTYDAFGNLTSTLRVDAKVVGTLTPGQAVNLLTAAPSGTPSGPYVLVSTAVDHQTSRLYDRNNRLLKETDAENYSEGTDALDAFGQRLTVTNKLGYSVSYTYDRLGHVLTETLPVTVKPKAGGAAQAVVNAYVYDSRGNRITSIEAQGLAEQRTTQMRYDGANRLIYRVGDAYAAVDSAGTVTAGVRPVDFFRYDARGNVIEQVSHGQLAAGDMAQVLSGQATAVTPTGGKRSVAYYDALNQKTLEISADRVVASFSYDAAGNQVTQKIYATRLGAGAVIDPMGSAPTLPADSANDRTLHTLYDAQSRKIQTSLDNLYVWDSGDGTNLVISGDIRQPSTVLQKLFYDAAGNATERVDGRGNSSYEYFDGLGRRVLSIDAGGAAIAWEYGRAGNVATRETKYAGMLPKGSYLRESVVLAGASAANDPVQLVLTIAGVPIPAGEQNRITEFGLDRLDRVTEKRVLNVAQDYIDANGTRTQSTATAVTQYQYNGLGAVTQIKQLASQVGAAQAWEQTDIVYDGLGRETHRQAPLYKDYQNADVRPTTDTEYDGLGNVRRRVLRGKDDTVETDDRITFSDYDADGQLIQTTDAAGAVTIYAYDANGNLSRRVNKDVHRSDLSDATKRDIVASYEFDAAGRVIVEKHWESDKTAAVDVRKTRYNAFGEIEARGIGDGWEEFAEYTTLGKVSKTNSGDGAIKFYFYDANGNVTREVRGNGDASVNLLAMTVGNASISNKLYSRVSVYNSRNLLVKTIDPQIEFLKNTVSMGTLYQNQWVSPWYPATGAIPHDASFVSDAGCVAISGSTPKLVFNLPGGHIISRVAFDTLEQALATDIQPRDLYGTSPYMAPFTDSYAWDISALKGQGTKYVHYIIANGDDPTLAARYASVNVSSDGVVTFALLPATDKTVPRNMGYVTLPSDPNNGWIRYSLQDRDTGIELNNDYYAVANGRVNLWQMIFPGEPGRYAPIKPSENASQPRHLVIHFTNGYGTSHVNVDFYGDGHVAVGGITTDPMAQTVSFAVKGRNVPYAALNIAGQTYNLTGNYRTDSGGYTVFNFDARNLPLGPSAYVGDLQLLDWLGRQLKDEEGNPLSQHVQMRFDGGSIPQIYQEVTVLKNQPGVTITRVQSFNAFGDVVEERDERVAERMLAVINDDRKTKGLGATTLTNEQLAAARTTLQYNVLGQLVAKIDPETFITAENGYRYRARPVTRYGYDLLGRHTTTTTNLTADTTGAVSGVGKLSRTLYAAGGKDEEGAAATFDAAGGNADVFNATGGAVTQYGRDIFGDVRKITDAYSNVVLQDYDAMDRLIAVTRKNVQRFDINGGQFNAGDLQDRYAYDELGQRIRFVNAVDSKKPAAQQLATTTDYDALGRVVKTVTAAGTKVEYLYTLKQASDGAILAMTGAVNATGVLTAATKSGGYIKTTLQADGRSQTDEVEYFGHTTRHKDLAGATFTYTYNSAGQLARQTSTVHAGQTLSQDTSYTYYANGYIQSQVDNSTLLSAEYAYDNAGNRVYEGYFKLDSQGGKDVSKGAVAYQNSTITYDELNRIVRAQDTRLQGSNELPYYDIHYEFDAVGNRRLVDSVYGDGAAGYLDRQTYWYAYDSLDRFTVTKGQLSTTSNDTSDVNRFANAQRGTSLSDTSVQIIAGTADGVLVGYDKLSRRASAAYTYNGQAVYETYDYSSDGYLQNTRQGLTLKTTRVLDDLGRTIKSKDLVNNQETQTDYDADNRQTQQRFYDGKDSNKNYTLDFKYYDAVSNPLASDSSFSGAGKGALAKTVLTPGVSPNTTPSSATTTTYEYVYWDSALQGKITKTLPSGSAGGITTFTYDVNGHIRNVVDGITVVQNTYITTASGLVLKRDRWTVATGNVTHHSFYYADDHRIGDVSDTPEDIQRVSYAEQLAMKPKANKRTYYRQEYVGSKEQWVPDPKTGVQYEQLVDQYQAHSTADFDQNYEPINDNYPGAAASMYTVRGDSETLASVAQTLWGDRAMWYLIGEANGLPANAALKAGQLLVIPNKVTNIHNNSTTWRPYNAGEAIGRTDPTMPAPPPPPKKGCGAVGTLIMVAVAVVATIYTAGAAGAYFGVAGAGAGGFAGGVAVLGGAGGLAGAAVAAGAAAVGSIASQAVGLAIGQIDSFSWKSVGQAALGSGITAGVGSVINGASSLNALQGPGNWAAAGRAAIGTGVNMALHGDWNWRNVMISAVSAGVGSEVGGAVGNQAWAQAAGGLGQRLTAGMAGALTARALTGGQKASYETVFASTLGSAIGDSLASPSSSPSSVTRPDANTVIDNRPVNVKFPDLEALAASAPDIGNGSVPPVDRSDDIQLAAAKGYDGVGRGRAMRGDEPGTVQFDTLRGPQYRKRINEDGTTQEYYVLDPVVVTGKSEATRAREVAATSSAYATGGAFFDEADGTGAYRGDNITPGYGANWGPSQAQKFGDTIVNKAQAWWNGTGEFTPTTPDNGTRWSAVKDSARALYNLTLDALQVANSLDPLGGLKQDAYRALGWNIPQPTDLRATYDTPSFGVSMEFLEGLGVTKLLSSFGTASNVARSGAAVESTVAEEATSPLLKRYLEETGGRWGSAETRLQNHQIASSYEQTGARVTGGAGRGPEEWIPGAGGGTKGGTFVDITIQTETGTLRIQTVTTMADGITPTAAEAAAAQRIRLAFPNDQLILVPKVKK